jgi:hypothetical protein
MWPRTRLVVVAAAAQLAATAPHPADPAGGWASSRGRCPAVLAAAAVSDGSDRAACAGYAAALPAAPEFAAPEAR